jgi:hypothetical protein
MPLTKVTSSLINNISASQIQAAGATAGQVLTYNESTSTWVASAAQAAPSVGVNQTWQDVESSRALGTTYTNTTGRPIMISVTCSGINAAAVYVRMFVNGVNIGIGGTYGQSAYCNCTWIVPAGATYSATNFSNATLQTWFELR